ncbi:MAG: OmpA family protein [Myxococcales bacterium]|nr:OmpA family protein [Myxococcales bacterium]MDP3500624.1 OmpA family protein [Myxococcales bacterium]
MKKLLTALSLGTFVLAACTEDLAPITKTWTETLSQLTAHVAEVSKTAAELKVRASGVMAPPADDTEGSDLKAKLDATVAGVDKGLADAQVALSSSTSSVNEAITKGKVAGVQTAIDKAKADVDGAIDGVKAKLKSIEELIGSLDKRAAEAAEKARAAAAAATATAVAPPTVDPTKTGEADYDALDFKDGSDELDLDKAATKASLDALIALMNSCKEIVVEVEGHTSKVGDAKKNKELSAKRAQAVTRHLINAGKVSPSKVKKTYGYGSDKPAMEEPEPGSDAEKAMDPSKLAAVRDRNERVHLRILKPCPAGK